VTRAIDEAGREGDGERRLVARLRAGEGAALEELYVAFRRPSFGFLVRLARDRHVAEDLFQNTWVEVSRRATRPRQDTELRAWIFTVARNEFRSYRRWQLVDVTRLFAYDREREEDRWYTEVGEGGPLVERGLALLATLAAPDREVLLLVCVEEMEPRQAAQVLGISHAALRQRLGRARARLKDAMTKLETVASAPRRAHARQT